MGTFYRDNIIGNVVKIGDRDTDIGIIAVDSAPTDGTSGTGAGELGKGSLVIAKDDGFLYENRGTKADPTWNAVGEITEASLGDGSVTETKIATDAVTTDKLEDEAVTMDKLEGSRLEAGTTLVDLYKVMEISSGQVANAVNRSANVVGVNYGTGASGEQIPVRLGIVNLLVAEDLSENNEIKVGFDGDAALWRTSIKELEATAASAIDDVTSPAGSVLEVLQLTADVEAMRGKVIRVVGSDNAGNVIWEDFTLDATDTETPVVGTETFETVAGAYVLDGTNVDTNAVRVRVASVGATVLDIAAASNHIGASDPTDDDPHYSTIDLFASDQSATFVTILGVNSNGVLAGERMELDNAVTNSESVGTVVWKEVLKICTGELNTGHSVRVDATADDAGTKIGRILETVTSGNTGKAIVEANWV